MFNLLFNLLVGFLDLDIQKVSHWENVTLHLWSKSNVKILFNSVKRNNYKKNKKIKKNKKNQ